MFKNQQMFSSDPARLAHKERHLRDYHIRNWLKMNRTQTELLELSLNYFYGEYPKLLGWSLDLVDGDPKGLVIASIIREGGANAAQAEILYEQLQSRVSQCRSLVEEVSRNSGLSPAESKRMLQDRVGRSGMMPTGYSTSNPSNILIINRPTVLSVCAILFLLSAALTTIFVLGDFPGMQKFHNEVGLPGLVFSIAFTAVCGWGFWSMKKWAVLLYAIDPIARFALGMPHALIAIPLVVAAIGLMHLNEMTWN